MNPEEEYLALHSPGAADPYKPKTMRLANLVLEEYRKP
jgi:hypothetical protein